MDFDIDIEKEDTRTRAGDMFEVFLVLGRHAHTCPTKVIAICDDLVLVEYQRENGATGLYEARRDNPYAVIRQMRYRDIPAYWQRAMKLHKIPWLGKPRLNQNRIPTPWEKE